MAENMAGIGKPSKASEPILALDPVDPPGQPVPIFVNKNVITIEWTKPEYDGGFKITGYTVEKKELPAGRWMRSMIVKETEATISGLNAGEEYMFRVAARNEKGTSDPRQIGVPVIVKDLVIAPVAKMLFNTFSVMAGEDLTVDVPYVARPKANVSWVKNGEPLKRTSRVNFTATDTMLNLIIKEATRDDVGKYVITLSNTAGETTADIGIVVLDKPSQPGGPVKVEAVTSDSVTMSWNRPEYDGGCTIKHYIVEKRDTSANTWVVVSPNLARTKIKAGRLKTGSEYQFRITAENRYGKGPTLLSECIVAQYPYKLPGPPGTPNIAVCTKDSMVVVWNEPVNDGGSTVLGYHIERKERNSIMWVKLNKSLITDQTFKTTGLEPGMEYEYRVYAENIVGIGKMSKVSEGRVARDPCDPPGTPEATKISKDSVTIAWDKPEYDGGAKVTGYVVEKKELPEGRWLKANFTNIIETEYVATGLVQDNQYEFRVIARNAAGVFSLPSYSTGPITAKDEIEPPRLSIDPEYTQTVVVNAGDNFKIDADVHGKPLPSIHWMKGGQELGNTIHREIKNTPIKAFISVKEAKLSDGGQYTLLLKNPGGEKAVQVNVVVLDKPGEPEGPLSVTGITKDRCCLSWKPPLQDGGSKISHYIVNRRETSRLAWTVVDSKLENTCLKVTKLLEGDEYIFKVQAVNQFGVGASLESAPAIIKDPYAAPGTPKSLEVSDIRKDSMVLTWEAPAEDGGSPITGYIIEKHDKEGVRWTRCNRTTVTDCTFKVTGLMETHIYEFRVAAENGVGSGEPSTPTVFFKALDPIFRPGPPHNPKVTDTTKTSVFLSWGKPVYEAALKETAQIEVTSSYTSLVIDKMSRNDSGKYTITAENTSGTKSAFVVVRVLDTPSAPVNLKVKEITNQSVTLAWEPPLLDGGSKIKNYIIEKRESTRKTYAAVATNCHALLWKVEPLQEGCSYYFRVLAENAHGVGLPAATADPLKVSEVPQSPKALIVTDQTKTSISLAWERPEYDGGSRVMQYLLEVQLKGQEKWNSVNTFKTMEATVSKLNPGEEYLFRVIAINDKGKSDPKVLSGPVMTKDLVFEPDIRPAFSSYSVKVGKDMKVDIPFFGRPKPSVSWSKDGAPLKFTTRVNIINTPTHTTLSIKEAAGDDGGMYSINVANAAGKKDTTVEIIVLDKPSPPSGPVRFDEITTQSVTLSWDPPKHNGGCQISNYIVQKRDTTTTTWENFSINHARTTIKVPRLKTGAEYQFRIIAQNRYGKSQGLDSSAVVAQYPYREPGPPGTPFISSLSRDHQIVEWHEPVADGGSAVLGYHLERKERNSILWVKINKTLLHEPCFKSYPLEEGIEYEYRVYAENIVGIGRCSKISEGCVARDPCDPPGTPEAIHVNKDTIVIQWTKPEYDGGSNITGYTVEKRDLPEGRWVRANFTNVIETQFTVTGLTENAQYDFRVIAKNAVGTISKPSYNSGPVTASDKLEAPKFSIDPAFTKTVIINAGETFKLDADVRGKPLPTIQWFRDEKPIENTLRLEIKDTENHAMIVIKDAVRIDGGVYTLQLTNEAGKETIPFQVVPEERVEPPQ
uniref:Titin n=1 Tax=Sander lucioperca TaxID=283035 RepID=A0A8C9Z7H8_SANLU